jgi:hypothetical protein
LGAAFTLAVVLASCGGDSGQSQVATLQSPKADQQVSQASDSGLKAFFDCMRRHGFEMDTGSPNATNSQSAEFQAAEHACSPLLKPGASDQVSPLMVDRLLKYAQCMRAHGIPMSDPQRSGNSVGVTVTDPNFGPSSPEYRAADAACIKYMRSNSLSSPTTSP